MNQLVSVTMALSASNRKLSSNWCRKQWEKFMLMKISPDMEVS